MNRGLSRAGVPVGARQDLHRSWTDPFGTALATVEGRVGGRTALVVASPPTAPAALEAVLALGPFQGRVGLAVLEHPHAAPLESAIRALSPAAVVVLERGLPGPATGGPAVKGEPARCRACTGLDYFEPGVYPAWSGGWLAERLAGGLEVSSGLAGLAASLGLGVTVCAPEQLAAILAAALA